MSNLSIIESHKKFENDFSKKFIGVYFDSEEAGKQYFNQHSKSNRLFLMFENSKLVGFFYYLFQYSHHANYLADICVSKSSQGKGYSKHLLAKYVEISKEQRKKNKITLSSTHLDNKASQKMHLKFGFEEIGILRGLHYGTDEIFYAYNLE
ncbi:MAG: GNAT family N-acetyltransferase [Candidatus Heimdallarchaeota archaeon]|nr:GNAT family N-acetyltransferase [Candidatus Heimdallarchaeota archaeon]